jgi:ankyrin repeat protein
MGASVDGHIKVVNALLAKGANVHAKNTYGMTALMLASENGHEKIVKILKAAGAKE